jgi:hypothetical protein
MSQQDSAPSGATFYIDPPADLGPAQREAWLKALAEALANSESLEMDVVTSDGGAWTVEREDDPVAPCRSKVVIVVNGRPCGPKLLDPGRAGTKSEFTHDGSGVLPPPPTDA